MDEWKNLTQNKSFITDLGDDKTAEINGSEVTVGRYAVWSPVKNNSGHMVIEVNNDLEKLKKKYNIPCERVFIAVS